MTYIPNIHRIRLCRQVPFHLNKAVPSLRLLLEVQVGSLYDSLGAKVNNFAIATSHMHGVMCSQMPLALCPGRFASCVS